MLKKLLVAALMWPLMALAQSYPSPTFNNLTVQGTFTSSGNIGLPSLAAQAANTVVANVTASSATPTAVAIPSCSSANSALKYTSGTGLTCGTTYAITSGTLAQFATTTSAQLAGVISDETGSGSLVFGTSPSISGASISGGGGINGVPIGGTTPSTGAFTTLSASSTVSGAGFTSLLSPYAPLASPSLTGTPIAPTASLGTNTTQIATTAYVQANAVTSTSPTITTPNIVGVTNASNAAAGSVGELISTPGSAISISSTTITNVASIPLTAGDWDVQCTGQTIPAGSTTTSTVVVGITTTSGSFGALGTLSQLQLNTGAGYAEALPTPVVRINVSSATTVFCDMSVTFAASTMQASAQMRARRVR